MVFVSLHACSQRKKNSRAWVSRVVVLHVWVKYMYQTVQSWPSLCDLCTYRLFGLQSVVSLQSRHSLSVVASDWRSFMRGRSLNLSRWDYKIMDLHFRTFVGHFTQFKKKQQKKAPLENMLIFIYNNFQQMFYKILFENRLVVKLVDANEHLLSQSPYYMSGCIWYKNEGFFCVYMYIQPEGAVFVEMLTKGPL